MNFSSSFTPFTKPVQQSNTSDTILAFPSSLRALSALRVAVVIPCYNEAQRLDTQAFSVFLARVPSVDFIFMDDGSRDATLSLLTKMHDAHSDRVHVVALSANSGKAEAVRRGLIHATHTGADLVGYWDADLATPLDAIEDFARIAQRFDAVQVVYGARRKMLGHRVERTLGRRAVSRICAALARLALRLPIGDTQCGAKLFRNTPALQGALARPFSAGWLFDVELFARLRKGCDTPQHAFYELPLAEWTEIAGSKVSSRAILCSGLSMLRLIAEARLGVQQSIAAPSFVQASLVRSAQPVAKAA